MKLFVPGRLCLMGEHSDWAGSYRKVNGDIFPGETLAIGIMQGIYAEVEKSHDFSLSSTAVIAQKEKWSCEMDTKKLKAIAEEGGFFSYVAGVAAIMCSDFSVGGISVSITRMDLPMKKGLSSSAAICVLIARAFNLLYNLNLSVDEEMDIAFRGERLTPSLCGRLDQVCAYGKKITHMRFDGDEIDVKTVSVAKPLYFACADLNSSKNTVKILSDLNKCYPFARNSTEKAVHKALGEDNHNFIKEAIECIGNGNTKRLGQLMDEWQKSFDRNVAPACMEELQAKIMHSVWKDEKIRGWIYGGKGVGSQGDGCIQFLARDRSCQQKIIGYLRDKGMECFEITAYPDNSVKKAIIPVAGNATRLFPATKVLKKSFLPVMDEDGVVKPALLVLLEQLQEVGIDEIGLVIKAGEEHIYDSFFAQLPPEVYDSLSDENKELQKKIESLKKHIVYITQQEQKGFGHAVYQCRDFAANEPVLLLLGDTIYRSCCERNCIQQLLDAFSETNKTTVSIGQVALRDVANYGILCGEWSSHVSEIMNVSRIYEKPTPDFAEKELAVRSPLAYRDGYSDEIANKNQFYGVFGIYLLTDEAFRELELQIKKDMNAEKETDLTGVLDNVRLKYGLSAFAVKGKSYDLGVPEAYYKTFTEFANKGTVSND